MHTTRLPTLLPTLPPSAHPTLAPSKMPSAVPMVEPTAGPSDRACAPRRRRPCGPSVRRRAHLRSRRRPRRCTAHSQCSYQVSHQATIPRGYPLLYCRRRRALDHPHRRLHGRLHCQRQRRHCHQPFKRSTNPTAGCSIQRSGPRPHRVSCHRSCLRQH